MEKLSEEDINKLYTYCALNENGKNIVAKISEMNDWKEAYVERFTMSYVSELKTTNSVRALYCDPDTTYKKSLDNHFFERLVTFLNEQENCFDKKLLKGKYTYKFEVNKGIKVTSDNEKDGFYLKSDQLGFSAPTNEKVYPYDLFLIKSRDIDKALKQVANWIVSSRTIGGSFLWPEQFYKKYNLCRGGKIDSKNQYYIQDRVDLTLWEIFYWYENNDSSNKKVTKMTSVNDEKATDALEKWLSHFKTFETYIEFFCFQDFVKDKSCPINILSGSAEEPQWNNTSDRKPEITELLELEKIKAMLERLNNQILNRSKKMEQIIASKCNKNSKTK